MQLNRAQRRAEARYKPGKLQRAIPKHIGGEVQRVILDSFSLAPVADSERQALMLPAYAKLDLLASGGLDMGGYYDISRCIVFGIYLCAELASTTSGAAKVELKAQMGQFEQARQVMRNIADRFNRTGLFGASGDDLRHLRESLQLIDELTGIAEKRHAMRADQRTAYSMTELRRIQAESAAAGKIV